MHESMGEDEPSLREIAAKLAPCDLVLVEGYKRETHKKIELRRQGSHDGPALSGDDPTIVAIASDQPQPDEAVPVFDINDIEKIADFIEREMAL